MSSRVLPIDVVRVPPGLEPLRAEVRTFLDSEIRRGAFTPQCDSWLTGWDEPFSRRLAEHGWIGMTIPRRYGGQGRTVLDRQVVLEELLAVGAPVAAHWIADRQTAPSLLRYGSEQQRAEFLPEIAAGRCYFAIGMSEPDSGSDLASVRTRAVRVAGGWRLTGTKVWTSGAHRAQWFFVLARSAPDTGDRHAGLSQFIVNLRAEGVTVRPVRLLTGEHEFNEVQLDGVFVPDRYVLGEIGSGWGQVTSELGYERSGPERLLTTFPLLAALVSEVRRRADRDPAAVAEIGALTSRLLTLRQLSLSVAGMLAAGKPADVAAALVKDLGTRFEQEVAERARMLADEMPDPDAALGTFTGHLVRGLLHSPGYTLRGGTNEVLRGVVAKALERA
ncbi:acyl-CoA dehydrogenase family protein [Prauserella oleivorans]|uniref:Acyl-CoA dehydrogenase family protein n=6 Tax=Bacteria TaxID=2 RepID=A0A8E1W6C7_9PSEU|nr:MULTISPECIES: acyl-CoA dehydrogenase family protein [Pseudonocardiaceae]PXY16922.1 acyl-CoA dehydrogenase [Prauserella coralliicola]AXB46150.1 acyl-CoA dehydrogenase [Amycolatopsis albispora]MBB2505000.1 acyl-CoA dehydrogenase family protein [Amycolatopsis echigonensis]MCF6428464.1 acyl-CoA dehydrogenase family protein [Amycolatopsis tucumanensis]PXY25650.1 acyl-CoA dehydrogenase [Prauserella flavalba]